MVLFIPRNSVKTIMYNPIIEINNNHNAENTHEIRYASFPYYTNLTDKIIKILRSDFYYFYSSC